MNTGIGTARLLGAAQLAVFLGALLSDRLLKSAVGTGSIADKLVSISNNVARLRISNLVALLTSVAIVVLGVLFYVALHKEYRIVALVALAFFVAEGITLAGSKIGTYALIPVSQEFADAAAPPPSYLQTLGDFLYHGVDRGGYDIHMLFFCLGAILWYALLYASRAIPRGLAMWGVVAAVLLLVPTLLALYDRDLTFALILGLPYAPYELVLGIWLLVRGFN